MREGAELAAPQGFEPRYADPESAVLPLNEGAALAQAVVSLSILSSAVYSVNRSRSNSRIWLLREGRISTDQGRISKDSRREIWERLLAVFSN